MKGLPLFLSAIFLATPSALAQTINGHIADQFVGGPSTMGPQDGTGVSVGNPGGFTLKVGRVGGTGVDNTNGGRNAVYVFQLPDLGTVADPFTAASLSFGVGGIDNNTAVDADLYGLARRDAAPGVLATDYYFGNAADATDATRLQTSILVNPAAENPTAPNTIITTDDTGSANLLAFLNVQYEGGAGVGQYVYLRLNVDGAINNQVRGYNVYTGDAATSTDPLIAERAPKINYSTSVAIDTGDFDSDGDVDGDDFLVWQRNVGAESGAALEQGDANGDGAVNGDDLTVWRDQFGAASAIAQAVPEPATAALMLLAVIGWAAAGRRT